MSNSHLHILHLSNTGIQKLDDVCQTRYGNLMSELIEQEITEFTIWNGIFDELNTKQAINKGHLKIIQYAKDNNLPYVIIAEDDIHFSCLGAYDYFISKIPEDFDLFCGLIYQGEVNEEGRILNGMSGSHSLYVVNQRFYDFILSQPIDVHCDRNAGQFACDFKYYVCNPMCVIQRGGYSFNLAKTMYYDEYLRDKVLYNG